MKKVVGIISYFVDNKDVREYRKHRLLRLIERFNELFDLPIQIVAQNYNEEEVELFSHLKNVSLDLQPKLGISGAREHLRKWFVTSSFDYIILIDDDVILKGNSAEEYLRQIEEHPDCFMEFTKSRHQLMAISKYCYSQVSYTDVEPERGEGFEDRIVYNKLCKLLPDRHFCFKDTGLVEEAVATKDEYSTWYTNQDIQQMLENTFKIINNIGDKNQ